MQTYYCARNNSLLGVLIMCAAVNECDPANPRHDCEQICVSQDIGFNCMCNDGYRLMENNKSCTGKYVNMHRVIRLRILYTIRAMNFVDCVYLNQYSIILQINTVGAILCCRHRRV